jgi:hypothetical protein
MPEQAALALLIVMVTWIIYLTIAMDLDLYVQTR